MPMSMLTDETLAWLEEYGIEGVQSGDEFKLLCPFHADTDPSCSLNLEKRVFRCYACDARGDIVSLLSAKLHTSRLAVRKHLGMLDEEKERDSAQPVSLELVTAWHRALVGSKKWLNELRTRKGLNIDTAEKYLLGLNDNRVTMPVMDGRGEILNVRMWSPTDRKRKVISMDDRGEAQLFPLQSMQAHEVVITEGEMKALLLCQLGFNAVSPTGGAGTWNHEWNRLFEGRTVFIIYDIDKAGRTGANKVARQLYALAKELRIVALPISDQEYPTGDITDFVVKLGHSADSIRALMDATPPWQPAPLQEEGVEDPTIYPLHLAESSLAKWCNKLVRTEVVVSAKDTAPYIIPKKYEVRCPKDREYCALCPVFNAETKTGDPKEFSIDSRSAIILEMVNTGKDKIDRCLKRHAGIPKVCDGCRFKVRETQNVEEVRLIPQLQISSKETEHVVRRAFYIGHGIETNTQYSVEARVLPEPNTQYATLMAYKADASVDSLTSFDLKPEVAARLGIFRPAEWTKEAISKALDALYHDLEANVTCIYGRRDMHLFYDLIYHSVLYVPFQGKVCKGWVEGLVLGDSGQGKSETITRMMKHYGVGEKVDAKGASVAGLLGGLQETAKRWFVSWGIITLNDRRMVVLEEVKGMSADVIARLTDMRSSGIAEIPKIEKARANARCRLAWISNPRSDRQVLSYNFGIEAVKELIGALEDVRRFDMAIMVASGEVDKRFLNLPASERPRAEHVFTGELCRALILWAWSRNQDQVHIEPEAESAILRAAAEMGERYTSRIPLVESADQRLKLARLSASLAARTYSTDTESRVVVRKCHVEYMVEFLDRLYSSPACGYREFSSLVASEDTLHDAPEITKSLESLPHAKDAVRAMLESPGLSSFDLVDWTGIDSDRARNLVGLLVRKNAIKRGRKSYVKTPPFIVMLKRMQIQGLTNETEVDQLERKEKEF